MIEQNRIIAKISSIIKNHWDTALETVELNSGDVLFGPGAGFDYVYFPIDCIISMSSHAGDDQFSSSALIGNEGMVGASALLDDMDIDCLARVEFGGRAYRLPIAHAIEVANQSSPFRILMLHYMQALVNHSLQTAICDSRHSLLQRVSRIMLLSDDRLAGAMLPLQLEFIAQSVGIDIEQVAEALNQLQRRELISFDGQSACIVDRLGLEQLTCDCYRLINDGFDQLTPYPGQG